MPTAILPITCWKSLCGQLEMGVEIPNDFGDIVQQLIADGKFKNEGEIVAEGIRLVIARESLARRHSSRNRRIKRRKES